MFGLAVTFGPKLAPTPSKPSLSKTSTRALPSTTPRRSAHDPLRCGYGLVTSVKDYEIGQWLASQAPEYETALDYASSWLGALAWIDSQLAWVGDRSHILDTLARLAKTVFCLYSVFHSRDVGGLAVPKTVAAGDPENPEIGSLSWLMRVSHSVSRGTLHPEVEQALRGQITSLRAVQK